MQRIKISQNPDTGSLEISAEPGAETSQPAQTVAAASLSPQREDGRSTGNELRLPEAGDEQRLALFGRGRDVREAEQTLRDHSLNGSFVAHFEQQLERGKIRIGVIDDFGPSTTHGRNVEERILSQMPQSLRDKVEIVRYDVAGLSGDDRARVISQAANDAKDKNLLALSVSGGINAYPVGNIERLLGNRDLTQDTAREAYDALIKNNNTSTALQQAMRDLNQASGKIPVVTPVWNNETTTLPALLLGSNSGNGIVTSIDRPAIDPLDILYNATQISGLVDVTVPAQPGNPNTSQSSPYFIGNLLRYGLEQYEERHPRVPTPQPGPSRGPRADGGTDPVG
jgi:hypothetical protein